MYKLNTDFGIPDKEHSDRAEEMWSHFHNIMTLHNGKILQNCIYLNENFTRLWNETQNPIKMLETILKENNITADTPPE